MMSETRVEAKGLTTRAWIIGGSLLLAAAVVGDSAARVWSGTSFVRDLLVAAALLLFAFGFRGAASITARRPVPTIALTVLAISLPISPWLTTILFSWDAPLDLIVALTQATLLVQFAFALIAVMAIGRLEVVPSPFNWAPALALAAITLSAVAQAVAAIAITQNVQEVFVVLVGVDEIIRVGTLVALGVIAIVLGDRATRHSDFSDSPRRAHADRTALNS